MLFFSSNYISFSTIFLYQIDILPRSIGELPKNNQKRDTGDEIFFGGELFFWLRGWAIKENFNSQNSFLEEFLSNRAENVYTYSSKGVKGPKALHFPKFSENFPQFSNPKILFSFLKCRSFKFFFSGF